MRTLLTSAALTLALTPASAQSRWTQSTACDSLCAAPHATFIANATACNARHRKLLNPPQLTILCVEDDPCTATLSYRPGLAAPNQPTTLNGHPIPIAWTLDPTHHQLESQTLVPRLRKARTLTIPFLTATGEAAKATFTLRGLNHLMTTAGYPPRLSQGSKIP